MLAYYDIANDNKHGSWHIGDNTQKMHDFAALTNIDIGISIDGHELERVRETFTNIPWKKDAYIMYFTGEMARFIMNNL